MKTKRNLPKALSAKGSLIHLENGRSVIDAISSWWVITLGHCEPAVVEAVQKQTEIMDQVLFANFSHQIAQNLANEIKTLLPDSLEYLFFSDDGSTSVESALKMAVQSWKQRGEPERNVFLSFQNSYHGDTVGAMSVSGQNIFNYAYEKMLFSVIRAEQAELSSDPISDYLSDFEKKLDAYHQKCAGVIIEPLIQGAGGMIMWPKEAVREICFLARKKNLYLIFDEVMTGFGRTGEWFAFEKLGVVPDLLCLSKGLTGGILPLALTIANENIYDSFLSDKKEHLFFHGHSFTGNPISCAAAVANIKAMKTKNIKFEWKRIESFHQKKIKKLRGHKTLRDARVCGTVVALDFDLKKKGYTSDFAEKFTEKALKEGVFLRPLGNVVYILPPYCISDQELEQVWSVIEAQF